MTLYHMSGTLKLGDILQSDYCKKAEQCQPFIDALEQSTDCLYTLVHQKKDLLKDGDDTGSLTWNEYIKWCVEGIFEYVRMTEYTSLPSRMKCNYYFDTLEYFEILYQAGWEQEPEDKKALIHLYEIELSGENPPKFDMLLFDEAYDVMVAKQDIRYVVECARRYFKGEQTENPVWEIMSDNPAKAVKDITEYLKTK